MAEERDDPVPTEDPRQTETSDQNAEENPAGTSGDEEAEPGQATRNPDAAD